MCQIDSMLHYKEGQSADWFSGKPMASTAARPGQWTIHSIRLNTQMCKTDGMLRADKERLKMQSADL